MFDPSDPSGNDDWRIRIDVAPKRVADVLRAIESAAPFEFKGGTRARYPVSHSDEHIFIYAGSEAAARNALAEIAGVLADHDLGDAVSLWRWHPIEERWEDATVPLPDTQLDEQLEHERREALEARRSREEGFDEWEVRITLPTRKEAIAFEKRLADEGVPVTRGFRHVIAGAPSEDDARALAQQLRAEAPEGSLLHVEPEGADAWRITHPFPFLGGLGG
jgi:hypothetical protein